MAALETKDLFSLSLSATALVLSLAATLITLWQKKFETERTLRHQLTDAIGKLNEAFGDSSKLEQENANSLNEPTVTNLRSFYNGQKIFYAHQAIYLIEQIPDLVSDAEYNSVARAFLDVDDDENAVKYYRRAIDVATTNLYRAINLRGLGRTLIRMNMTSEGRESFEKSLALVAGQSDSDLWFQAETLQRWAQIEAAASELEMAQRLFQQAEDRYRSIRFPARRSTGLKNLTAVIRKASQPLPQNFSPPPDLPMPRVEL
jgi:tetratricopeptide (TPR) repeat protein